MKILKSLKRWWNGPPAQPVPDKPYEPTRCLTPYLDDETGELVGKPWWLSEASQERRDTAPVKERFVADKVLKETIEVRELLAKRARRAITKSVEIPVSDIRAMASIEASSSVVMSVLLKAHSAAGAKVADAILWPGIQSSARAISTRTKGDVSELECMEIIVSLLDDMRAAICDAWDHEDEHVVCTCIVSSVFEISGIPKPHEDEMENVYERYEAVLTEAARGIENAIGHSNNDLIDFLDGLASR